jgi:rhodanese-related sulfurtransferase/ABC-type phosphate/phosphonate transport system substrate-binding protein
MKWFPSAQAALRAGALALATCASLFAAAPAQAQYAAMVAIDPSASERGLASLYTDLSAGIGKALKLPVRVDRSTNFADVLRSTRTGEYDIYIVPVQVAASGLAHGYRLVADSGQQETFVLVAAAQIDSVAKLKGARMYLPQQDSIYSYMAKGLLNEHGLSLKELKSLQYQKTSGAGLVALEIGVTDATVTRKAEFDKWAGARSGKFKVLLESKPVPAGLAVLVKKTMAQPLQERLAQWAETSGSGMHTLKAFPDATGYTYIAGLGHFTPAQLPGVKLVSAHEASQLMKQGVVMVDVRSAKEFNARRIAGAVLAPYLEKSQKDTAYDPAQDDFSALAKLDKSRPHIFACNGAECWKSYKASRAAVGQGFKTVYWLRGGLPEWDGMGLPVATSD